MIRYNQEDIIEGEVLSEGSLMVRKSLEEEEMERKARETNTVVRHSDVEKVIEDRDLEVEKRAVGGKNLGVDYEEEEREVNGYIVRYLVKEDPIIRARDKDYKVVSPMDVETIRRAVYLSEGRLSGILKKLNWAESSKGELLYWVTRHGLRRDILLSRDSLVDKSERVVSKALKNNDVETAKFVLKTAGKYRGWNEKSLEDVEEFKGMTREYEARGKVTDVKKMSDEDLTMELEKYLKN